MLFYVCLYFHPFHERFQKADFAGTLFTVSEERFGVLDFSEHIYLDEMTAAYVRPGIVPNMAGFVHPYTFLVRGSTETLL